MGKASTDEVDHVEHPMGVNTVRRPLSDALGTTDFGMVYYELEPGDTFSGGLMHRHTDQEEVFYVQEGTAAFEIGRDREEIAVEAGETIRIPPGEFQKGYNRSDERVVALALSAPGQQHDWEELDVLMECATCGTETVHDCLPVGSADWQAGEIDLQASCQECGTSISTAEAD